MTFLFKKTSVLDKRLKRLQRELSSVDNDIRSLSRSVGKVGDIRSLSGNAPKVPGTTESATRSVDPALNREGSHILGQKEAYTRGDVPHGKETHLPKAGGSKVLDERFADYLTDSFQSARPLRHQRGIARNRAIVMMIVVLVALFWVISRFFL